LASSYLNPVPQDFTAADPAKLTREKMIEAVTRGRKDTAMQAFAGVLSAADIAAVVDFIRETFMAGKGGVNTYYHTAANGWPNHERYAAAFPFALGEIPLDTPWEQLTPVQQEGKRLFMSSCITCHDRARVRDPGAIWDPRSVSYPRGGYRPDRPAPDAVSGATPYARHDKAPVLSDLTPQQRQGERLFQQNCAFCHAADGTADNWIGHFIEPHPRNLTDAKAMAGMTRDRLKEVIRDGVVDTPMSAWKTVLSDEEIDAVIAYIVRAFHPIDEKAVPDRRH
jgi:cytochrome c oxidase cbb3-type subunit 3